MKKTLLLVGALGLFGVACEDNDSALERDEGVLEDTREDVENAADDVEEDVKDNERR